MSVCFIIKKFPLPWIVANGLTDIHSSTILISAFFLCFFCMTVTFFTTNKTIFIMYWLFFSAVSLRWLLVQWIIMSRRSRYYLQTQSECDNYSVTCVEIWFYQCPEIHGCEIFFSVAEKLLSHSLQLQNSKWSGEYIWYYSNKHLCSRWISY